MHAQHNRFNNYHSSKRQLLGNQPGHAAPAWRVNNPAAPAPGKKVPEQGSKILLSRLPLDVAEEEVEQLFSKTVGPVKDVFVVYNSQARSKGMAVVSFQRPGDAALARAKYNGKIVDGRRPIKIEIVKDEDDKPRAPEKAPVPSLLQRLGGVVPPKAAAAPPAAPKKQQAAAQKAAAPLAPRLMPANPKKSVRQKKGPRRLKKAGARQKVDRETLDREMEDYRAHADSDLAAAGS
ncbi:hypothetical protein QCA50_015451 [Cerrena zonata]|uniref:RRM domain-containing protein n=1 Tax=Cerrena zonata TaxID=2478898 RepID=A0AAW0FIV9_9APHY